MPEFDRPAGTPETKAVQDVDTTMMLAMADPGKGIVYSTGHSKLGARRKAQLIRSGRSRVEWRRWRDHLRVSALANGSGTWDVVVGWIDGDLSASNRLTHPGTPGRGFEALRDGALPLLGPVLREMWSHWCTDAQLFEYQDDEGEPIDYTEWSKTGSGCPSCRLHIEAGRKPAQTRRWHVVAELEHPSP